MNSTLLSTIGIVLGILLIILFIMAVVAYAFVRFWQQKTQDELKKVSTQFRQFTNEGKNLRTAIQGFTENDPPPFGALHARILGQLNEFDRLIQNFMSQYGEIQQVIRRANQKDLGIILRAPFSWYQIRRRMTGLTEKQTQVGGALQSGRELLNEIESQGWVVSGQARLARERMLKLSQIIDHLKQVMVQGSSFDLALQKKSDIEEMLAAIPEYYLTDVEEAVLSQSTKESISSVHQIIKDNQPEIDSLLSEAETWENLQQAAAKGLKANQQLADEMRQLLVGMPPGLILSEAEAHFDQLNAAIKHIDSDLAHPNIEDLTTLAKDASDVHHNAKASYEALTNVRLHHEELSRLIAEIGPERDQLVAKLAQLASKSTYPITWNKSQVQVNDLIQRIDSLGAVNKPRTPDQVDKDLALAKTLQTRIRDLTIHYQQIAAQYNEIIPILKKLDLPGAQVRFQKVQRLADQVAEYNPENWSRQEIVNGFKTDIEAFYKGLKNSAPENPTLPLKETDLTQFLDQLRSSSEQFLSLQQREERIRTRFEEIQTLETNSQEKLSIAQTVLKQIVVLANTNQTLKDLAGNEIDRLLNDADQLGAELENHQQGLVQKKGQKVTDFYSKVEQAGNNWFYKLSVDVKVKRGVIADKLERLREIADLSEPAIADAQKMLASNEGIQDESGKIGRKTRATLTEIMLQYKFANEGWQHGQALIKSIEDIETTIYDAYEKSEQQRQIARDLLAKESPASSDPRSWPPVSVTLETEHREFEEIERLRDGIRKEQPRALWLVGRFGDLSGRYQMVAEKARRIEERAIADHNRIRDLEHELDESIRLWQYQRNTYSSNTLATANIQRLLSEISRDLDNIKRQYRQGMKNYSQIEQDLTILSRKANNSLISIEDDQKIDINGEIRMERS